MKNLWILILVLGPFGMAQQTTQTIRGTVNDGRAPLANVAINV